MPPVTRWAVRIALVHLLVGFTIGALLLMNKALAWSPRWWLLLPAHMELLLVGWTLLLALGVATWILPRFQTARPRIGLVWLALVLVNAGVVAVSVAPFVEAGATWTLLGRAAEAAAAILYALHAWPRVKAAGV